MDNFNYVLLFGIILFWLYDVSCTTISNSKDKGSFNFFISGKVENGEGVTLFLYQPSKGLDNRLKSTIKNGEYSFKGEASINELAEIRFEENADQTTMYSATPIIIEKENVQFNFKVVGESPLLQTNNHKILTGEQNKFFFKEGKRMQESVSTWIFGDSIRMDSMIKFEYPNVRKNGLNLYSQICNSQSPQFPCLLFLEKMTEGFIVRGAFNKKLLSTQEKSKFKTYFSMIDTSFRETIIYQRVSKSIEKLEIRHKDIVFKEYSLMDKNRINKSLSSIINKNKFTILDFWWSGCGPCRKFNKEYSTKYEALKSEGIEIVGINVDQSIERWEQSSEKDGIIWPNLYAGKNSLILEDYIVTYFPTKLIFNSEKELVDTDFKNINEIGSLLNE